MRKHLPSAIILFALLLVLCLHAFAAEDATAQPEANDPVPAATQLSAPSHTTAEPPPKDGSVNQPIARTTEKGARYLAAAPVLTALCPTAEISAQDGCLTAIGPAFTLKAAVGAAYFSVNDRYYYAPEFVLEENGAILLPASKLAQALGCSIAEDEANQTLTMLPAGPAPSAQTYPEDDLYWLSRAIFAEAGNQPMAGRIAVGTVILNRVDNPQFPNTIKDVIFAPGQFSPVSNGTIYREPDEESVIAAKLCLDGEREAGDSLYFNVTNLSSWADQSRRYVCTIGGHNFYL